MFMSRCEPAALNGQQSEHPFTVNTYESEHCSKIDESEKIYESIKKSPLV